MSLYNPLVVPTIVILSLSLMAVFKEQVELFSKNDVIGLFFFSSVQLIFIGIIGEYVGATLTHVKNHPLVVEEGRLNFEGEGAEGSR